MAMTGNGKEITAKYIFENKSKKTFILHDWKETTLFYDTEDKKRKANLTSVPTVDEFWKQEKLATFTIVGTEDPTDFINWIKKELENL